MQTGIVPPRSVSREAQIQTGMVLSRTGSGALVSLAASAERQDEVDSGAAPRAEEGVPPTYLVEIEADTETMVALEARAEEDQKPGLENLETAPVEVLVHICSFLAPKDLGRLACVSIFGRKLLGWPHSIGMWPVERSVVEETARQWLVARLVARPADEQVWPVAQWSSLLRLMHIT